MIDISQIDYGKLDRPEILMYLFHPRPEWGDSRQGEHIEDALIPVEKEVVVGARFHRASGASAPNILFFHGNGEIVADYDDMGPMYNQMGINFIAVDYRGYGRSTGQPTVTAMMRDAHVIFEYVRSWLDRAGFNGSLVVMGRSLGSASALELGCHYEDLVDGLIIESGFAYMGPLLRLLGIDMETLGITEEGGVENIEKIRSCKKPTLVIHAERDHIISFSEGQALHDASGATLKQFLKIPGANHNDIFFRGMKEYRSAVKWLVDTVGKGEIS